MYSEWRSLYKDIETSQQHISVLHTFPESSARDISCVVVRCLSQAASNSAYAADSISIHSGVSLSQQSGSNNGALLQDENQVRWTMQALCYALSLPFSEYDTINECVQVYCGWLTTSLLPADQQRAGSVSYGDRYGNEKQKYVAPAVVRDNANAYAQEIFAHFRNLFMPRSVASTSTSSLPMQATTATSSAASFGGGNNQCDLLTKQTVLCRRVLNTVRSVARYSETLSSETWTSLLSFLIAANDLLLSPPSGDELNEQLGAVALNALIDCWLIACARHFPSPSLWKTLVEVCKRWRHHDALVTQWFRATYILTVYVLRNVFHLPVPNCVLPADADELCSMPQTVGMSSEAIVNAWFRFLHALGNPVDLAHANVIGTTDAFARAASSWNPDTLALSEHPCLSNLPIIFAHAMRTLATLVDAFLDTFHVTAAQLHASSSGSAPQVATAQGVMSVSGSNMKSGNVSERSTPPLSGKNPIKSMVPTAIDRDVKGALKKMSILPTNPATNLPNSAAPPTQIHPNVMPPAGSLVMLNGAAYRVAALHLPTQNTTTQQNSNPYADLLANRPGMCTLVSAPSANRLHFSVNTILHLFRNWLFEAAVTGVRVDIRQTDSYISMRSSTIDTTAFEPGRAEAAGALCRIFCSHRTNEQIFSRYLARFYICLHQGLRVGEQQNGLVLASILYYSSNLLRCDLDGVFVLLPRITSAIESVLISEGDLKFKIPEFISVVELRRASINLLLSCVCLPLHFGNIEIRELSMLISDVQRRQSMIALYGGSSAPASAPTEVPTFTFLSFKQRFISLMVKVVPMERDPQNLHMLLCGLILTLIDLTMHDQATSNEPSAGIVKRSAESEPGTLRRPADNSSGVHEAEDDWPLGNGKMPPMRVHGSALPSVSSLTNSDSLSNVPLATGFKPHAAFAEQRDYSTTSTLFDSLVTLIYGRLNKELSTTVTALEALAALARLRIPNNTCTMTPGQIVHNLCDWIASQIGKPQTLQTRDLHSTLVAAYSVVQLWLTEHPYVLLDRVVQHLVLETIELGISGSKSQPRITDPKKYKDAKGRHPNPASKRVLEAADSLLMTVLDQVGSFPPPSGPESTWSLVDELTVLEYCKPYSALLSDVPSATGLQHTLLGSESASSTSLPNSAGINTLLRDPFGVLTHRRQPSEQEVNTFGTSTKHASVPSSVASLRVDASFKPPFRYFAIENSLILCLCEQPLSGANELVPAMTAIVRGPFGRHAWCMHMRHLPVGAANYAAPTPDQTQLNVRLVSQPHPVSVARRYSKSTERPAPCGSYATFERHASPRYFPDSVDHAPFTKADASIPPLDQVGNERRTELDVLKATISKQTEAEQRVADRVRNEKLNAPFPNPETECRRPNPPSMANGRRGSPAVEFQTARMFLMHYGFLTLDGIRPDYNLHSVQQSPSHAVAAPSSLSLLDCSTTDFFAQLELLDQLPTRSTDLAFAFYVRAGQRSVEEILQNTNALNREKQYAYFTEFLLAAGWPVDPQTHNGWTGNTHESLHNFALRQKTSLNESDSSSENGAAVQMRKVPGRMIVQAGATVDLTLPIEFDCFYWADIQRELALLVPRICATSANSNTNVNTNADAVNCGVKVKVNSNSSADSAFEQPATRNVNGAEGAHEATQVRIRPDIAELLDGDSDARRCAPSVPQADGRTRSFAPKRIVSHSPEVRIFIFWLETFEDKDTLPISELLQTFPFSDGVTRDREKDVYVIGLHLLQTGLIRVMVQQFLPTVSKYGMAGPCVDGMVVSRRALGSLVRETVINIHRRRRLEAADGHYLPPHVRRRTKIQEIINKYKCRMIEPDFFVSLFQEP